MRNPRQREMRIFLSSIYIFYWVLFFTLIQYTGVCWSIFIIYFSFSTKSKCIFYKAYVDVLYDVWLVCWLKISALGRGIYLTYLFELCATNRTEEGDGDWRFLFDVDFNGLFEKDFGPSILPHGRGDKLLHASAGHIALMRIRILVQ